MAVNGIELAAGQVWRTREGLQATIISTSGSAHNDYPVIASVEMSGQKSYDLDGRFSKTAETTNDLVHYICNDDDVRDDWIEWSGGECPVSPETIIQWRLRNGAEKSSNLEAGGLVWSHSGRPFDIVAYRVVKADKDLQPAASQQDDQWMDVPGYEKLADVMRKAYNQAARGKGAERHANDRPFHEQPMLAICRNLGSIDGMLYQASKKAMEARGLPTRERALAEIYGAINYLCGAAILIEEGVIKSQTP